MKRQTKLRAPETNYLIRYFEQDLEPYPNGTGEAPRNADHRTLAFLCDRTDREPLFWGASYCHHDDAPGREGTPTNRRRGRVIALGRAIAASRGKVRTKFTPVLLYGRVLEAPGVDMPHHVFDAAHELREAEAARRAKRVVEVSA